jgi:phenylacetate-CoA ligase
VLDKAGTFGRFDLADLCLDGTPGRPASVLTSSGHSGRFSFGLYEPERAGDEARAVDDGLDAFFAVRSRSTLLINCLPMGVRVPTAACTLAETSVRPDMAVALVGTFARHYDQVLLVADAVFLKLVAEQGRRDGIDWADHVVHAIVGEEPLAENARAYLQHVLSRDPARPEGGMIVSSMGVAELGLNLLFETPPLAAARRRLHEDPSLRRDLLGEHAACAPMVMTWDPRRHFVEALPPHGELVVTPLTPRRLPLVRYRTGDRVRPLAPEQRPSLPPEARDVEPVLLLRGRGEGVAAGGSTITPEAVKEGLYARPDVAERLTGNFRLQGRADGARLRVQLSPGVEPTDALTAEVDECVRGYVPADMAVSCEAYLAFGDGLALDYERKFAYLGC